MLYGRTSESGKWHVLSVSGTARCAQHLQIREKNHFNGTPDESCERCQRLASDEASKPIMLSTSKYVPRAIYRDTGCEPMDIEPTMSHPDVLREMGIPIPKDEEYRKQYGLKPVQQTLLDLFSA